MPDSVPAFDKMKRVANIYRYLLRAVLPAMAVAACSQEAADFTAGPSGRIEAVIRAAGAATRTSIDSDDGRTVTVAWDKEDRIMLWARGTTPVDGAVFSRWFGAAERSEALFIGGIAAMEAENHTYFGVSPEPQTIDGTVVSYELPAVQSGVYDGALDILHAAPAVGAGLSEGLNDLELSFRHMTHALKITIPEGRNDFGLIDRICIEFPQPVVGTLSFDASSGDTAVLGDDASSRVTVKFPEPVGAGTSFWVWVAPVEISGTVTFRVYGHEQMAPPVRSNDFDGALAAGRITPVNLSVPAELRVTWIDYQIDWQSRLGEPVEALHLSLDGGLCFADGESEMLVDADDDGLLRVPFLTVDMPSVAGSEMAALFDSEHALVADALTVPQSYAPDAHNDASAVAPWLYFEDFSGVTVSYEYNTEFKTGDSSNPSPIKLDGYGLAQWTGARVGVAAGSGLRIMSRLEMGLWVANRMYGRAESAPVANIKPGKSVDVKVTYDYMGARYNGAGGSSGDVLMSFGYDSYEATQGGIAADTDLANIIINDEIVEVSASSNTTHYGMDKRTINPQTIPSCNADTRLCWKVYNNRAATLGANGNYWLYLDNIRVSIAGE